MVPLGCGSCRAILAEGDSRPCFAGRFARAAPYMWHIARSAWHVDTACLLLMQKARNAKSTGCLIGDTRRRTLHAVWRRYRPTARVTAGLWHGASGRPLQGLYAWHLLVQAMPFGGGRGNGLKTCVPPAAAPGRGRNRVRKEQKHHQSPCWQSACGHTVSSRRMSCYARAWKKQAIPPATAAAGACGAGRWCFGCHLFPCRHSVILGLAAINLAHNRSHYDQQLLKNRFDSHHDASFVLPHLHAKRHGNRLARPCRPARTGAAPATGRCGRAVSRGLGGIAGGGWRGGAACICWCRLGCCRVCCRVCCGCCIRWCGQWRIRRRRVCQRPCGRGIGRGIARGLHHGLFPRHHQPYGA